MFAVGLVSSVPRHPDAKVAIQDGTSFAAPAVAGAAALVLAGDPAATPAEVHAAIVDAAVEGRIAGLGDETPNRLLNVASLNVASLTPAP